MNSVTKFRHTFLIFILFSLPYFLLGATKRWNGSVSNDWNNANNWTPVGVPIAGDEVFIDPSGNDPIISMTHSAQAVAVLPNATLSINNTGSLLLNGSAGNGLTNLGTINNSGTITIENTALSGVSNEEGGEFNNLVEGRVNIDNTTSSGVINHDIGSIFNNTGQISIGQNGGMDSINETGIFNAEAEFNNFTEGRIFIDNTGLTGVLNQSAGSIFNNTGQISIGQKGGTDNIGYIGIANIFEAEFANHTEGIISIDNTVRDGVLNQNVGSIFNNKGRLNIGQNGGLENIGTEGVNNFSGANFNNNIGGEINIDNTKGRGVFNSEAGAVFNNAATINIGQNGGLENIGMEGVNNFSGAHFNNIGGEININNSKLNGLYNNTNGTFNNYAQINIDNTGQNGVRNNSVFSNNNGGEINIDNTGENGVQNFSAFSNSNGGQINIDKTGENGVRNNSVFININGGEINIDNTGLHGVHNLSSGSTFNNSGELNIGQNGGADNIDQGGILNNFGAKFANYAEGRISIDNTELDGVFNQHLKSIFNNTGELNIGQNGGAGNIGRIGILNTVAAEFANHLEGIISIDNIDYGVVNNSIFNNTGELNIGQNGGVDNIGENGINNNFSAEFANHVGGEINIENAKQVGLYNTSFVTFSNFALLKIGKNNLTSSIGGQGIINEGAFTNQPCASIETYHALENINNANFANEGHLLIDTDEPHVNTGVFTNNGVIAYPQGNDLPNVQNEEIIVSVVSIGCGDIMHAFELGNPVDFDVLGIFKDAACNISAGTYNESNNTFIPIDPFPQGVFNYFVITENTIGGCMDTLPWNIIVDDVTPPLLSCLHPTVQLDINSQYTLTENDVFGGGTDDCGVVTFGGISQTEFDCSHVELVHVITITADDGNGNQATCQSNVTVEDAIYPCCPTSHVLFVDEQTPNDNNGADWGNAFASLQRALEVANRCSIVEEIWVADGTYRPDDSYFHTAGDRNESFVLKNGLTIYGGFLGGETSLNERVLPAQTGAGWAILSGDIGTPNDSTDNSYHVIMNNGGGINSTAVLDGVVIKDGLANSIGDDDRGAGMFNKNASPSIRNCYFIDNSAGFGGGGIYFFSSSTVVDSCGFFDNSAQIGGAVFNSTDANSKFSNCVFENNTANLTGGAFFNNTALLCGITNCLFLENDATDNGGAVYNIQSSPDIINCTFVKNEAKEGAGITNQSGSSPNIVNCSFSQNIAGSNGGVIRNYTGTIPLITNCIVWDNGTEIVNSVPGPIVSYSIVKQANGVYPGIGNLNIDPLFVGLTDLRLQPCSPANGVGNNTANGTLYDLQGFDRKVGIIDLGAYEFQSNVSPTNYWTGNGDGLYWNDGNNWSDGFMPGKCQDVLIPTGFDVILPTGAEGLGKTLEVEFGSSLETVPAALMDIKN